MAVAQPLFGQLANHPTFFVVNGFHRLELVVLALAVSVGLPLVLLAMQWATGRWSERAADRVHLVQVGFLVAVLSTLLIGHWSPASPTVVLVLGSGLGLAVSTGYVRWKPVREYFTFLSIAPVVIVILFLAKSWSVVAPSPPPDIDPAWATPGEPGALAAAVVDPSSTPLVLVIFDALPLVSLLDADYAINPVLYPNFSALAASSTWYRNATTDWDRTNGSLQSILTGRIGELSQEAITAAAMPENLITLLASSHQAVAEESVSRLVPQRRQAPAADPAMSAQDAVDGEAQDVDTWNTGLVRDLGIVYLHLVMPAGLRERLPSIDGRWQGFGEEELGRAPRQGDRFVSDGRAANFRSFLDRIETGSLSRFYFGHFQLPHIPLRYMPSGKLYGMRSSTDEWPPVAWRSNRRFGLEFYQRHLLQVCFVDRLLGELVERLREADLFEPSLLVVLSDHGASFKPGSNRRQVDATPWPEDILRVPLLIKQPFQVGGRVDDRDARLVDVVPTVAEILRLEVPWPMDGRSLLGTERPPEPKVVRSVSGQEVSFDHRMNFELRGVARKQALFFPGDDADQLFRFGPHGHLVGAPVADFLADGTATRGPCEVRFDQSRELAEFDPAGTYVPSRITGILSCADAPSAPVQLAVAINDVLWAVVEVSLGKEGKSRFGALVPDHALTRGLNTSRFFRVTGEPHGETLALIPIRSEDE